MKIIPFQKKYKRDHFSCGHPTLDNYILRNTTRDVEAGACTCFVMIDAQEKVLAYYTLSMESISVEEVSDELKKHIKYTRVPVILLGRLAVDNNFKGKGYGNLLIADALKRSFHVSQTEVGSTGVIVDPIDDSAVRFYKKYGFTQLPDSGRMFITMKKIKQAFDLSKGK